MKEKVKLTFEYSFREIDKTDNPCKYCALRAGNFGCHSRKSCKYTNDKPLVYYFEGLSE